MYAPQIGGAQTTAFDLQFPSEGISPLSLAVTPIFHLANDGTQTVLSHGTGFFWIHNDQHYLISARHVFSGRDPFTDEIMSPNGFTPQRIYIFPAVSSATEYTRGTAPLECSLYNDDETPRWLEDPQFATLRTDIAALRVEITNTQTHRLITLNSEPFSTSLFTQVGIECSLLGYPTKNVTNMMTPVWRRGAIASEPRLPIDGKPMFLLDATTSSGFSGAPVFRRHWGPLPTRQADGTLSVEVGSVLKTEFVGVYAGRLAHTQVGGETPFVFYSNRISYVLQQDTEQT